MMRVCLLTSAAMPPREGVGYHVWGLARGLNRHGHAVQIMTRRRRGESAAQEADGIAIRRPFYLAAYPFHVHLHGMAVSRALRAQAGCFDVVNAHTPLSPPVSGGLPLIATVHSPMVADTAATRRRDAGGLAIRGQTVVSRGIERTLFRRSCVITAVARWIPGALAAYGVDAQAVRITGNAVDDAFFAAPLDTDDPPYGLYVGRLEASKGLLDLVDAVGLLEASHICPELRIVVIGDGPLRRVLARRVTDLRLEHRFVFLGQVDQRHREELLRWYRSARLFVLPSHHEGLPTVLLEAMASGLPIVATSCTGSAELVCSGRAGLLAPVADPKCLSEALATVWNDPGMRRRLGEYGRNWAAQEHTWDTVVERYVASYHAALASRG